MSDLAEASSWTLQTNANSEKRKLNQNCYGSTIIDGFKKVNQIETIGRPEIIQYTLSLPGFITGVVSLLGEAGSWTLQTKCKQRGEEKSQ